jgi:hypothetical protein
MNAAPGKPGLASRRVFYSRLLRLGTLASVLVALTLAGGTLGYHHFLAPVDWIDAFRHAAMLMSGMGPVIGNEKFDGSFVAKLFDSFYALFCGVVLLGATGLLFAPLLHRLLHRFHLEDTRDAE